MNPKTTVILVVVLALGAVLYLLTKDGSTPSSDPTGNDRTAYLSSNDTPLVGVKELGQELDRVTFSNGMRNLLRLERIQGQWWVTAPSRFPAKTKAVDQLLTQLSQLAGQPTGEAVGLIPDAAYLRLDFSNTAREYHLGKRLGAGRTILNVIEGDQQKSYSTKDTLHDLFDELNPDAFYAKRIDPPLMPEIGRIDFKTPEGESVLVQRDEQWWIGGDESPERALAQDVGDYPGIAQLFKLLQTIELIDVQDHNASPAAFGLENPIIRIGMTGVDHRSDQNESLEVKVGAPADLEDQTRFVSINYADQRKPAVFTATTQYAMLLGQSAKAFRDPRIVTTPPSLIQTITLISDTPEKSDALIRLLPDRAELIIGPSGGAQAIDLLQLEAMLRGLSDIRSSDFVPMESLKPDLLLTVAIKPRLNREVEDFELRLDPDSEEQAPTLLVRRGNEPVALRVPREALAGLLDPESLVASPR